MKVAAIQMVSKGNVADNLSELSRLCAVASQSEPDLVLLPENFALFSTEKLYSLAQQEAQQQSVLTYLAGIAQKYEFALVAGSIPQLKRQDGAICEMGKIRSSMLFINSKGRLLARYDKAHLFDVSVEDGYGHYLESKHIEPGDQLVVVEYGNVKIGLSIYYDLRFPMLYRALAQAGADIICVAAAFTQVTGAAHWRTLLQARAIENQCYVIGANQGGEHGAQRQTYGHSMIVDPWGQVISEIGKGPGVICSEIDLDFLQSLRKKMPILQHEKLGLPVVSVKS